MFKTLQAQLKKTGRWLPVALLPFLPLVAQAQALSYSPANAINAAGTYTDLGATGTTIATTSTDDANSAVQSIGFTFTYNNTAFTQFVLNTNGLIRLGAAAPSATNLFFCNVSGCTNVDPVTSTNAADVNLLFPFNMDLEASAAGTPDYRVATTGTAPNRVATIQWRNVRDKADTGTGTQYASMQFQVKLYETTNNIEFVYGTFTAGAIDAFRFAAVGIKGAGNGNGQTVLVNKASSAALWSTSTFITGNYGTSLHNIRSAVTPDAGRTYRFVPTVLLNSDVAMANIYALGKVSSTYGSPVTVRALVRNVGSSTQTALPVTLTVAGATTFTNTQTIASLAAGTSTTVTFTAYPVTTAGVNTLTVSVPADDNAANNSQAYSQTVTAGSQGYVDATQAFVATGVGVGATNGVLAVRYTSNNAAAVTSIIPTFQGAGTAGTTYQLQVYAASTTGTPGTLLYTSAALTRPAVTGPVATAIPSIPVNGDFFVAVKELNNNAGLAYQLEDPLRTGAFFYTVSGGTTWIDVSTTALKTRLALDVTLDAAPACGVATSLVVASITSTTASATFTAAAGATSYTVTVTPAGGTATTVTPAPTASPVALTGLTANTTYTVSVTTNCAAGQASGTVTTTFTTSPVPPTYATLPYSESFEGPWINYLSTRDAPTANWRNTPVTGNTSWRREDDGAAAAWTLLGGGAYAPASSVGSHSARFHSYAATAATTGTLDLFVNLSGSGSKTLTFDYINPTGADKLDVLVSTDGGATFSITPVLTATISAAFAAKTATIASTSATTVIRFRATSDFGDDDIGLDNLRLTVVTATRNEALATTVNLYPNPAHQRFTLGVPAGSLHNATATLINALGQVVQTRQLNLPVAGGNTDFDVSRLAAGVYSLQLKSGNDLVVKRVVVE